MHGTRENHLKDVSVEIPKHRLTVITGVSGSGKSSTRPDRATGVCNGFERAFISQSCVAPSRG